MSVPGRIGIILIIALALVDAFILMSGAKHAATAIETHAQVDQTVMVPTVMQTSDMVAAIPPAIHPLAHEPLLSAAIREINMLISSKPEKPARI